MEPVHTAFADPHQLSEILALAEPIRNPLNGSDRQAILVRQHAQPVIPALGAAGTVLQQQVHHSLPPSAESRLRGQAACLPARMGGGGETGIDALARASGR
jgi:hypothetical protein